jgi:RNA polymerase sigma factor (sigma-70 family)
MVRTAAASMARVTHRHPGGISRQAWVPGRVTDGRCHGRRRESQLGNMSTEARAAVRTTRDRRVTMRARPPSSLLEEFEQVYLRNVDALLSYFARRCRDPHTVADLTSETFVRAVDGFSRFDPRKGSDRAWLFGIAAHVFARHCEQSAGGRDAVARLGGHRLLDEDEIEELAERIDAEREGAALMRRFARLPEVERAAIELVDLEGLTPKEAALALSVSGVAFRKRLSRARYRLRKEHQGNE